jgi:hypothetical protein
LLRFVVVEKVLLQREHVGRAFADAELESTVEERLGVIEEGVEEPGEILLLFSVSPSCEGV